MKNAIKGEVRGGKLYTVVIELLKFLKAGVNLRELLNMVFRT